MAVSRHMGGFGAGVADGLVLRHDNGANYISEEFQSEIAFFGIESSRSFVRQPQGNGVAERFIRTLKEQLMHGRVFAILQELRKELDRFAKLYNERWLLQKHGHKTPNQVRAEQREKALEEGAGALIRTTARTAKHRAKNGNLLHSFRGAGGSSPSRCLQCGHGIVGARHRVHSHLALCVVADDKNIWSKPWIKNISEIHLTTCRLRYMIIAHAAEPKGDEMRKMNFKREGNVSWGEKDHPNYIRMGFCVYGESQESSDRGVLYSVYDSNDKLVIETINMFTGNAKNFASEMLSTDNKIVEQAAIKLINEACTLMSVDFPKIPNVSPCVEFLKENENTVESLKVDMQLGKKVMKATPVSFEGNAVTNARENSASIMLVTENDHPVQERKRLAGIVKAEINDNLWKMMKEELITVKHSRTFEIPKNDLSHLAKLENAIKDILGHLHDEKKVLELVRSLEEEEHDTFCHAVSKSTGRMDNENYARLEAGSLFSMIKQRSDFMRLRVLVEDSLNEFEEQYSISESEDGRNDLKFWESQKYRRGMFYVRIEMASGNSDIEFTTRIFWSAPVQFIQPVSETKIDPHLNAIRCDLESGDGEDHGLKRGYRNWILMHDENYESLINDKQDIRIGIIKDILNRIADLRKIKSYNILDDVQGVLSFSRAD